jgi:hypothetical protein
MEVERDILDIIFKKFKGKDKRVVAAIATHPLYFFKQVASNSEDERPIRIRYFGIFALKKGIKKIYIKLKVKDKHMDSLDQIYDNQSMPRERKIVVVKYQMGTRDDLMAVALYRNNKFYGHFTNTELTFNMDNILEWRYATAKDL